MNADPASQDSAKFFLKKIIVDSAEVAQSVEQRPEKPCVASSILALGIFLRTVG